MDGFSEGSEALPSHVVTSLAREQLAERFASDPIQASNKSLAHKSLAPTCTGSAVTGQLARSSLRDQHLSAGTSKETALGSIFSVGPEAISSDMVTSPTRQQMTERSASEPKQASKKNLEHKSLAPTCTGVTVTGLTEDQLLSPSASKEPSVGLRSDAPLCKRGWPEPNRPVEHGTVSRQEIQVSGSSGDGCLTSLSKPQARGRSGDHVKLQASYSANINNTAPNTIGRQFLGYVRVGKQLPSDEVDTTRWQTEDRSEAALAPAKGNISNDNSDYLAENVTDGSNARGLPLHGVYPPRWEVGIEVWRPRDGEDGAGLRPGHHDDPKPVCDTSTRVDGPAARPGSLDQQ